MTSPQAPCLAITRRGDLHAMTPMPIEPPIPPIPPDPTPSPGEPGLPIPDPLPQPEPEPDPELAAVDGGLERA